MYEENRSGIKLAIMQPYFLPYIGYFQLIAAVDHFTVYDNIKYTKKGWINRNRFLLNGADTMFSLPLQKASDDLNVVERYLAADFNRGKLLNQLKGAYSKAPHYAETLPLLDRVIMCPAINLFEYIHYSLTEVCAHLGLTTRIERSSEVRIDHGLKAQDKVIALCLARGAATYINAIGGTELYRRDDFAARGLELRFLRSRPLDYVQFGAPFVPWLSILDVLMFNPLSHVKYAVTTNYDLV
jgi:hypothetical protein